MDDMINMERLRDETISLKNYFRKKKLNNGEIILVCNTLLEAMAVEASRFRT